MDFESTSVNKLAEKYSKLMHENEYIFSHLMELRKQVLEDPSLAKKYGIILTKCIDKMFEIHKELSIYLNKLKKELKTEKSKIINQNMYNLIEETRRLRSQKIIDQHGLKREGVGKPYKRYV